LEKGVADWLEDSRPATPFCFAEAAPISVLFPSSHG
jgi:hypothetical protein